MLLFGIPIFYKQRIISYLPLLFERVLVSSTLKTLLSATDLYSQLKFPFKKREYMEAANQS